MQEENNLALDSTSSGCSWRQEQQGNNTYNSNEDSRHQNKMWITKWKHRKGCRMAESFPFDLSASLHFLSTFVEKQDLAHKKRKGYISMN